MVPAQQKQDCTAEAVQPQQAGALPGDTTVCAGTRKYETQIK